jgi:hypothetical protein
MGEFNTLFGGNILGSHDDAAWCQEPNPGDYTLHSRGSRNGQYNFHFDKYNPLRDLTGSFLSGQPRQGSIEEREKSCFNALTRDSVRACGGVVERGMHGVHGVRIFRIIALEN